MGKVGCWQKKQIIVKLKHPCRNKRPELLASCRGLSLRHAALLEVGQYPAGDGVEIDGGIGHQVEVEEPHELMSCEMPHRVNGGVGSGSPVIKRECPVTPNKRPLFRELPNRHLWREPYRVI